MAGQLPEPPEGEYIVLGSDPGARSKASFRLASEMLDPDEVSRITGLTPTLAYRKGDRRQLDDGREASPYRIGMWSLDSAGGVPDTAPLDEHLNWLLDCLEPAAAALAPLMGGGTQADFFCGYFMSEWNAGWTLAPTTLQRIGTLGAELGVDIYGPSEPDAVRRITYGKTPDPLFDALLDIVIDELAWLERVENEVLEDRIALKRMEWITHQLARLSTDRRRKLSEVLARRSETAGEEERATIQELLQQHLADEDPG
jgi:hypothetical protein